MSPNPPAGIPAAQALWVRSVRQASAPAEVAAAADLMFAQLRAGLGRWIGADGYLALLERALAVTRIVQPDLDEMACVGADATVFTAIVRSRGVDGLAVVLVALVSELIDVLGRIIGTEMAVQLVDQVHVPSPRGVVSTPPRGERDDD